MARPEIIRCRAFAFWQDQRDVSIPSNFPRLAGAAIDYESIKANAFHDQQIAVIDLNDSRIPWPDREIIQGACERIYGKREA